MGSKRCPKAFKIAKVINEIFKDGIPLPTDQRFHYCTFTVAVRQPSQSIQFIALSYGIRGTKDSKQISSDWSSASVNENFASEDFEKLKNEAKGKSKPSSVPKLADVVSTTTVKNALLNANSLPSSLEPSKIEKID